MRDDGTHAAGLVYPKSGAKVPVSTVHTILRNRLYTGWFEWNGKLIQGKPVALVPVELWERVRDVLDGRFVKKAKRGRHKFAFSGLIACHACSCAVVGEMKKEHYVYYHCTGYADKCQGNPAERVPITFGLRAAIFLFAVGSLCAAALFMSAYIATGKVTRHWRWLNDGIAVAIALLA